MLIRPFRRPLTHPISLTLVGFSLLGLGVGATLLGARRLGAQTTPERGFTMVYLAGLDTIGVERVRASASGWTGDLRMRGQPRVRWTQRLGEVAGVQTLDIEAWAPGAADSAAAMQRLTLRTRGDSAYVYATPAAGAALAAPQATLAARRGASWLVNQSLVHGAWLAQRTAVAGRDTAWVMLASGARLLPGTVARHGDSIRLTIAGLESVYRFGPDGAPLEVLVPAQRLRGVVLRGTDERVARPAPVSYAAPAGAPYIAEQVRVPTPMGHALGATLTRPVGAARVPAVITISGSGAQERDEAIPGVADYRPFRELADTLGRRGIAVLRFDDRGTGESGGNHGTATSRDFADDVRALIAWLRARPDIDADRIALLGHSEGGLIAPMVAAEDPRVAGVVLLAGPAYTGARIIAFQQRSAIAQAYPSARAVARDSMFRAAQGQLDSMARSQPWLREFLTYDPLPSARRVRAPVLILQGETDLQVTAEQADTLTAAFRAGGNTDVTTHRLRSTNHLFQRDASGLPSGYGSLPDRRVTKETLGLVADWLSARLRDRP